VGQVALGGGEVLLLVALVIVAVGATWWMSRRGESHAVVAARTEAQQTIDRANRQLEQVESDRAELARLRDDVERREARLDERSDRLDQKRGALDERTDALAARESDLERKRAELLDVEAERRALLENVAGLSAADAKAELVASIENEAKREAMRTVRETERAATDESEALARRILTTAIQRLAAAQTAESVVTVVPLPGSDMKGRIIGREGRNVRTFEQVTGVNVIIDDTPDAVLLSCFDPVRRETARVALEQLVVDGRIHPSRIEEVFEQSKAEVERLCVRAGEDATVEFGITDLHPELVRTLGQLRYRTSYGQNVLEHLRESARLARLMADEIGLDRTLCVRGALLHDLGKALTHEAEGSHALVGAELARRHGESDDVVHAIEAHHNEVEPRTVEAVLVQAADAISGSRPGARRESLESYVKRLKRLEEIAGTKPGVDRVFAMQAGREVRVMVLPDEVDDIQAQVLARDIAKEFEEELTYPGQIKVVVVRESRTTEVAR
jgi:ribonucrease Y